MSNSAGSFCIGDTLVIASISMSISQSLIAVRAPIVEEESFACIMKSVSSSSGPGDESELSDSMVSVLAFLM